MGTKTLAEKLLIKPKTTIWVTPAEHYDRIGPLPEGVRYADGPARAGTAVIFASDADAVRRILADHDGQLAKPATLWVAYPKGNRAGINRDTLWPMLALHGLRPIGQVAVDDVWSALRFRPLKDGEAPFTGGQ